MITTNEPEPVEVLKYPYPYEAAFTVASDIDSATIGRFRAVHALFTGTQVVAESGTDWQALGLTRNCRRFDPERSGVPGLGLELADSFFLIGDQTTFGMYRHFPEESRFREDMQGDENCATLIRRWIREGQIDSFHTFLHYRREQVKPLLTDFYRWCEEERVEKPRVWINHSTPVAPTGLCPRRLQSNRLDNLTRLVGRKIVGPFLGLKGKPLRHAFSRYYGDKPGSDYYINDLLVANGLRYIWLNAGSYRANQIALAETRLNGRSTFLKPVTMDDGARLYEFERCYGTPQGPLRGIAYLRDSAEGFDASTLINERNLQELVDRSGACILYTHWTHHRSLPVSDQTLSRFELIARWRDAGKLWVTRTSRLLEWTRRRTFLKLSCQRQNGVWLLEIEGVDDPIVGRERVDLTSLQGLCFRVPAPSDEFRIALNGQLLNADQVRRSRDLLWLDALGTSNQARNSLAREAA